MSKENLGVRIQKTESFILLNSVFLILTPVSRCYEPKNQTLA
jgi:hypothetical protein